MLPQVDLSQYSDEQILSFIKSNPDLKSQYDQFVMKKQQEQKPTQNLHSKPLTSAEYLKVRDIKEYLDSEGGMMIEPTPHFVLKAFDENGEKVFFNVTSHHAIDAPEQKQLVDQNNEEGIRVPMSVGSIKEDHDVKGDICKVIDLVVNPGIAETMQKDMPMRDFFCSLVQSYVFQKYKLKLQEKFIAPKLKYKGKTVSFQRVKGKKPPKVEVVQETSSQKGEDEDELEKIKQRAKEQFEKETLEQQVIVREPDWDLYIVYPDHDEQYDGDLADEIINFRFEIQFPLLVTGRAIKIKANKDQFQLTNGRLYALNLRFPKNIDINTIQAQFVQDKRVLFITAQPYVQPKLDTEVQELTFKDVELDNNLIYDIL